MKIWNKILLQWVEDPKKFMGADEYLWMNSKVENEGTQETSTHIFSK
jgi:hypothetical protein